MSFPLDPVKATSLCPVRVRFCEADLMGIVHHANYFVYLEAARVEWLRRRGATYTSWTSRGVHLAVVEASLKYLQPARFDDTLSIRTVLAELRHASARFEYEVLRDGAVLSSGTTRLAAVTDKGTLMRFDQTMLGVLTSGEIPGQSAAPTV